MAQRTVMITGASQGLGLFLSKHFAEQGYRVIGISRTKKHWKKAKSFVRFKNFELTEIDLSSEANIKRFFSKLGKKKIKLDLLINNAGYAGKLQRLEEVSVKELNRNWQHNLVSQFLMTKYVLPIFHKNKKGFIINVSSMAGKRAVPRLFPYSASKFAGLALSQCTAKENMNVKCITVCPGGMNTKMRSSLFGKEDAEKQQSPDFVANVIMDVANGKIAVESGGDIVIRHGKITAINPSPAS